MGFGLDGLVGAGLPVGDAEGIGLVEGPSPCVAIGAKVGPSEGVGDGVGLGLGVAVA